MIKHFIRNPKFLRGGSPLEVVRWYEAIAGAYQNGVSMAGVLTKESGVFNDRWRQTIFTFG